MPPVSRMRRRMLLLTQPFSSRTARFIADPAMVWMTSTSMLVKSALFSCKAASAVPFMQAFLIVPLTTLRVPVIVPARACEPSE